MTQLQMRVRASSYCQVDDRQPFLTPQNSYSRRLGEHMMNSGGFPNNYLSTVLFENNPHILLGTKSAIVAAFRAAYRTTVVDIDSRFPSIR
ncbi:unnamed protein product [Caenorhabditis auriculariae]|uniref:Uncharacterized protein n=1 Tax=Caenorhabditis auriculariae TaxID=2777116 RepID=A0A8S1GW32_9PELO|nr:unnamed protein product [Caenorhabditis auriculariae]